MGWGGRGLSRLVLVVLHGLMSAARQAGALDGGFYTQFYSIKVAIAAYGCSKSHSSFRECKLQKQDLMRSDLKSEFDLT